MNKQLFILTPSNSGSSFLVESLLKCKNIVGIPEVYASEASLINKSENFGMYKTGRLNRYNTVQPHIYKEYVDINWKRNNKYKAEGKILIEKSPGYSIFAAMDVEKVFEDPNFIILIRNPYAYVEGICRRDKDYTNHKKLSAINYWVECAKQQIINYKKLESRVLFTYESMCNAPEEIEEIIKDYMSPYLDDFSLQHELRIDSIEGRVNRAVTNYNEAQISKLSISDISLIKNYLKFHQDVLEFFNYN